jgi:endonuclease YncB( thermonuclease family)
MHQAFIVLITFIPSLCFAQSWNGKVVEITDGDTYEVRRASGGTVDVRLYGIDCPESDQPYGGEAADRILYETVEVEKVETGPYGRLIGMVSHNGTNINGWLVSKGLAWVSDKYCNKPVCRNWKETQREKQSRDVGLWAQDDPLPT